MDSRGIGQEMRGAFLEDKKRLLKEAHKINNQKTYKCGSCGKRRDVVDSYLWVNDEGGDLSITCGNCTLDGMLNNLIICGVEEAEEGLKEEIEREEE